MNIAKTENLISRVTPELKAEVVQESKRRKITISEFVERAVLRELRRKPSSDALVDLVEIQEFVQTKIQIYQDTNPEADMIPSLEDYVQKIYEIQERRGYVSDGLITYYARLASVTRKELLESLDNVHIED